MVSLHLDSNLLDFQLAAHSDHAIEVAVQEFCYRYAIEITSLHLDSDGHIFLQAVYTVHNQPVGFLLVYNWQYHNYVFQAGGILHRCNTMQRGLAAIAKEVLYQQQLLPHQIDRLHLL